MGFSVMYVYSFQKNAFSTIYKRIAQHFTISYAICANTAYGIALEAYQPFAAEIWNCNNLLS